jgi:hypothetical protein
MFIFVSDTIPMERFYIVVGVLAGIVVLQFLVIIGMRISSKRDGTGSQQKYSTSATNAAFS